MSASFGILALTATMAAAEPDVTLYHLQNNCEKLAAERSVGRRRMTVIGSTTERIITPV